MSVISKVTDEGLVATLHEPVTAGRHPAVIVLSWSEGGIVNANARYEGVGHAILVPPSESSL